MSSIINADNGVVSGSVGLKYASDNSGVLALQTNGTTAVTVDSSQNVGIAATPKAWRSTLNALQIGRGSSLIGQNNSNDTYLTNNIWVDSTGQDYYINNGYGGRLRLNDNGLLLYGFEIGRAHV